jgi:hypothetical protein
MGCTPFALIILFVFFLLNQRRRSYYNPIDMNRNHLVKQVDVLMLRLMNHERYSKISRRWRDGEIVIIHDDVETFTYDNTTIHISLSNSLERNTMMYVMLHELTHIQLESTDHGQPFIKEFEQLLRFAEEFEIYSEVTQDDTYGGISIKSYDEVI